MFLFALQLRKTHSDQKQNMLEIWYKSLNMEVIQKNGEAIWNFFVF